MCQWGTQRFALQGQLWNWIGDHYYNNNGRPGGLRSANMTSPLDVASFSPDVSEVAAGDFFTVFISAVSYAELAHTEVMLGASLYSDATGYISDPAQDAKVTLYPGTNDVARGFNVPLTASMESRIASASSRISGRRHSSRLSGSMLLRCSS